MRQFPPKNFRLVSSFFIAKELQRKLLIKLKPVAYGWYRFGIALNIPTSLLKTFKSQRDAKYCFIDVIDYWMKKPDRSAKVSLIKNLSEFTLLLGNF